MHTKSNIFVLFVRFSVHNSPMDGFCLVCPLVFLACLLLPSINGGICRGGWLNRCGGGGVARGLDHATCLFADGTGVQLNNTDSAAHGMSGNGLATVRRHQNVVHWPRNLQFASNRIRVPPFM